MHTPLLGLISHLKISLSSNVLVYLMAASTTKSAFKRFSCQTVKLIHQQDNYIDCGLFALAYTLYIYNGQNPGLIKFDQPAFREHFNLCVQKKQIIKHKCWKMLVKFN